VKKHLARRVAQLYVGLVLYGTSGAMMVLAGLGLDPWNTLHQGLSRHTGIPIGTWVIIVGFLVMLVWIPLRQKPGFGTLSNAVVIGLVVNAELAFLTPPTNLAARIALMCGGVLGNGVATGCYIGARLGPGPRDGLTMGLAARGYSIRVVRTMIEVSVVVTGWLLGGTVGLGTDLYALAIGPMSHFTIPFFTVADRTATLAAQPTRPLT
jgi:uncharacterized membrane protein YczE